MLNTQNAEFLTTAATAEGFVREPLPTALFAGRSNVGKSSLINSLLRRKSLARVGAQPGKTTQINYYKIDGSVLFADLPGYGYAKHSYAERDRWAALIDGFFKHVSAYAEKRLGLLVIDARHGPADSDMKMADYFRAFRIPYVVVANKADKLKKNELEPRRAEITKAFAGKSGKIIMYSSETGSGRDELLAELVAALSESIN